MVAARHWENWPEGCYRYISDNNVFYNNAKGDLNERAERYCKFATFSPSGGDCKRTVVKYGQIWIRLQIIF